MNLFGTKSFIVLRGTTFEYEEYGSQTYQIKARAGSSTSWSRAMTVRFSHQTHRPSSND